MSELVRMSLLRYFKQRDGLPDPRGELSTAIRPSAIARANREVLQEIAATTQAGKKRGPYRKYCLLILVS